MKDYPMKNSMLTVLTIILTCTISLIGAEFGVAIPVSHNPQTNEWSVLLGLHKDNQWSPFQEELNTGEKANKAAGRALKVGTNGLYTIDIQNMPWEKLGDYYYHLVPVPTFIRGNDLYEKGRNKEISDFAWVPVSQLLQKGPIKIKPNNNTIVAPNFLVPFQAFWQKKSADLVQPQQSAQQPAQKASLAMTPNPWKQYAPQATSWQNIPGAIYFYESTKPYYEFTNFYEQSFTLDNKLWPTTEQYYQAAKFTDPNLQEKIRTFKSDAAGSAPRKAFDFGNKNKQFLRADWFDINLDAMRKAIHAKFTQHPALAALLLKTGNAILVENAGKNDAFFGAGQDYLGQNWLGRILMEVRAQLQTAAVQSQIVSPVQPKKTNVVAQNDATLAQALNLLTNSLQQLGANLSGKAVTTGVTAQKTQKEVFDPFAYVVGIPESQFKKLNEAQKQAFKKGDALLNQQTNTLWNMGTVEVASIEQLRKTTKNGKGSVFNVIEGVDTPWNNWFSEYVDVTALQAAPENKDAVFQVASNFNGLEGTGDPKQGIMPYLSPGLYVQGEAAAISAMPGIIYRMYYMPHQVNGVTYQGQLQQQFNLLERFASEPSYALPVHNGYIQAVPNIENFANIPDQGLKNLAGYVNIAFHKDIQVSGGLGPLKNELPTYKAVKVTDPTQRINQIFAAAMNPYNNNPQSAGYKNLAQMLLYAAYEGGLKSAYAHGKKKVYLTLIGGGVFENDLSWITKAIEHAVTPFLTYGDLEINLIVYHSAPYKQKNPATWQEFATKMKALVDKSEGEYVQYRKEGKFKL